jgi:hypothetical protein
MINRFALLPSPLAVLLQHHQYSPFSLQFNENTKEAMELNNLQKHTKSCYMDSEMCYPAGNFFLIILHSYLCP